VEVVGRRRRRRRRRRGGRWGEGGAGEGGGSGGGGRGRGGGGSGCGGGSASGCRAAAAALVEMGPASRLERRGVGVIRILAADGFRFTYDPSSQQIVTPIYPHLPPPFTHDPLALIISGRHRLCSAPSLVIFGDPPPLPPPPPLPDALLVGPRALHPATKSPRWRS